MNTSENQVSEETISKKQMLIFLEKMREERRIINEKIGFLYQHKFHKEEAYWRERSEVFNSIYCELDSLVNGFMTAEKANFGLNK